MRFDHKKFFDGYKAAFGKVSTEQTAGLDFLLSKFEEDNWTDVRLIAYCLATVKHETANRYQPIKEYRSKAGTKGRANQDRYWLSGFYGRGYVQLTWKTNYQKMSGKTGIDIVSNPNGALHPDIAYEIMVVGMLQGLFTGKKLSDYINDRETDYVHARRVVNGMDKADLIAGYAKKFEKILKNSKSSAAQTPISKTAPVIGKDADKPPTADVQLIPADNEPPTSIKTETSVSSEHGVEVKQTTEKTETTDDGFTPESFDAKIPQIGTAKLWLKYLFGGGILANVGAGFADLPEYLRNGLMIMVGLLIVGGVVLFVIYYREIFKYVTAMNTLRATKDVHNPELTSE